MNVLTRAWSFLWPHLIATVFWIAALTVASNGAWSFGSWRGFIAYALVLCGALFYSERER